MPIGRKQKEWLREGFQNQHQRAVLEMLFKDTLTPAETRQVKSDAVRVIVHNEAYRLPEANSFDEVLSNCIVEIIE